MQVVTIIGTLTSYPSTSKRAESIGVPYRRLRQDG
jgi:hypothetical protein